MFFFGFLPQCKNAPEKTEAFLVSYHYLSNIQVKFHTLITIKKLLRTVYIILVYVHISEVQRYILQWQVYLSCHEVKVIYIGWQSEVCITASLIGRQNQLAFVYLELNQAQAWCLVALRTCLAEEQHIVL